MKVLYIGYSKTGTKTIGAVFRQLGYKTYDYEENCIYLYDEWSTILKHGATKEDWLKMYSDVDAALDVPVFAFWEDILEAFPDTKVIVGYRDETSWFKSAVNQIQEVAKDHKLQFVSMLSPTARKLVTISQLIGHSIWGCDRNSWPWQMYQGINTTLMRSDYRKHNAYIKSKEDKFNIHVVNLKDGWEPICKFLGEPVPDVPFPHANKGGQVFKEYMETSPIFAKMKREMNISLSLVVVSLACLVYFAFSKYRA